MRIKQELNNSLKIKQKFSQKHLSSLKFLKMNKFELFEFLKAEKEENPLLEIENEEYFFSKFGQKSENLDIFSGKDIPLQKTREDFIQNIKLQIDNTAFSSEENEILDYILDSVDEAGFLNIEIKEIAKKLNCNKEKVHYILNLVKETEPNGIGTRNLKDFFKYQLYKKGIKDTKLMKLIEIHLKNIGNKAMICNKLNVSEEKFFEYINIIKKLKLKPLEENPYEKTEYIFPDIIIKKKSGKWEIELNEKIYKSIGINRTYAILAEKSEDKEIKEYLNEKIKKINFIRECIEKRNSTLYEIGKFILNRQIRYFEEKGEIIPIRQKDAAVEMNVHESTISRAVKNKYLDSPRGTAALKSFFSTGYTSKEMIDGEKNNISSITIKKYISEIIKKERENNSVYSDKKISEYINEKYKIEISRRTVSKYRKELKIDNKNIRKIGREK